MISITKRLILTTDIKCVSLSLFLQGGRKHGYESYEIVEA